MAVPSTFETKKSRLAYARALLEQGTSTQPVGHWVQGLARMLQAGLGGYFLSEESKGEKAEIERLNNAYAQLPGLSETASDKPPAVTTTPDAEPPSAAPARSEPQPASPPPVARYTAPPIEPPEAPPAAANPIANSSPQFRQALARALQSTGPNAASAAPKMGINRADIPLSGLSPESNAELYGIPGTPPPGTSPAGTWQPGSPPPGAPPFPNQPPANATDASRLPMGITDPRARPDPRLARFANRPGAGMATPRPENPAAQPGAADLPTERFGYAPGNNPNAPPDDMTRYSRAIAKIESGSPEGDYSIIGPKTTIKGRDHYPIGKYQVMDFNVGPWTKEILGKEMTPAEFRASPEAQEAVFKAKFAQYAAKHGPEGAAAMWFSGSPNTTSASKDVTGSSVANYVSKFAQNLGGERNVAPAADPRAAVPGNAAPRPGTSAPTRAAPQIAPEMAQAIRALMSTGNPEAQKYALALYAQHTKGETPTDDMREYDYARRQGFTGDFLSYQIQKRRAAATNITNTVDTKSESKFGETMGKNLAEQYVELQKGAQSADQRIYMLQALRGALSKAYTGTGAETVTDLKRLASSLGFKVEGVADAELARSISNQLALQLRNPSTGAGMPGALSDKDREFLVASIPGLMRTPEGNTKLLDFMVRMEKRTVEVARFANEYLRNNNGRLDTGFYTALREWSAANPLFTPDDMPAAAPSRSPRTTPQQPGSPQRPGPQTSPRGGWRFEVTE